MTVWSNSFGPATKLSWRSGIRSSTEEVERFPALKREIENFAAGHALLAGSVAIDKALARCMRVDRSAGSAPITRWRQRRTPIVSDTCGLTLLTDQVDVTPGALDLGPLVCLEVPATRVRRVARRIEEQWAADSTKGYRIRQGSSRLEKSSWGSEKQRVYHQILSR